MRTKVIRRLATGTCSVCLCYGLAVQALNGEMSAEAVTPELLTSAPALTAEPTQTPELPAFVIEETPEPTPETTPSAFKGKRHGKHAQERWMQPVENMPPPEIEAPAESVPPTEAEDAAKEADEEKKRVPEEDGEGEENAEQQQSSAGDPPTLSQFLSALRCGGCRHNCSLLNPRCMRGRSKQQAAMVEYTQTYGV